MGCQSGETFTTCTSVPYTQMDCFAWLKISGRFFREKIKSTPGALQVVTTKAQSDLGK